MSAARTIQSARRQIPPIPTLQQRLRLRKDDSCVVNVMVLRMDAAALRDFVKDVNGDNVTFVNRPVSRVLKTSWPQLHPTLDLGRIWLTRPAEARQLLSISPGILAQFSQSVSTTPRIPRCPCTEPVLRDRGKPRPGQRCPSLPQPPVLSRRSSALPAVSSGVDRGDTNTRT